MATFNKLQVVLPIVLASVIGFAKLSYAQQDEKNLVFIHYANETSPEGKEGENYQFTMERLNKLENATAKKIAASLKRDPTLFNDALETDRSALRRVFGLNELDVVFCEIDNQKARRGEFRYWLPGKTIPQTGTMEKLRFQNYILTGNPLATPEGLEACLRAISTKFPPDQHRYALVTLSHGSDQLAMSVKLSRRLDDVNDEQLVKMLTGNEGDYEIPNLGTTKAEYLSVLGKAGRVFQMEFDIVILESCKGTFDEALLRDLPASVGLLYASGHQYLEFSSIPYESILVDVTTSTDLVAKLDRHLSGKFLRVSQRPYSMDWRIWIWFLPIIALLLIVIVRLVTNRNRRSVESLPAKGET